MAAQSNGPGDDLPSNDETADRLHWTSRPSASSEGLRIGAERAGESIGPYRLLEVLGEGGFGTVWLAERREPMVQRVAIKVIKPGMDSRAVVARFEQERQALAVMDHPNVARVLDGGVTTTGRPFFVMELVKGEPITRYADRHRLTIGERLELFASACDAVQHAHMKGLIHRDIKPSNILVAPGEGDGRGGTVKVIDFGVAKAIAQTLTEKTIFTEQGLIIGTPEYMSPEQAEMGAGDVDTRTDVYSLGVVLYQLLCGALPFEPRELRAAGYDEIRRVIREVDPPKPSTRLSAIDDATGTSIGMTRRAERDHIARELRNELEWIPMKAIRKDRSRRYASAESLGADVRRYLEGRPLEAAPESRLYLARKFIRRNRLQVAAASAVTLALAAGMVATGLALSRALRAESDLSQQLVKTESLRVSEKTRADELKQVSDFQAGMLSQIDTTKAGIELMQNVRERLAAALESSKVPEAERRARIEALRAELVRVSATDVAAELIDRTILKPAVKEIDKRFRAQPLVEAELRQSLADAYRDLGRYDEALPQQLRALATRRRMFGAGHPDTLASLLRVGFLLQSQGKLAEAEQYIREAMEMSRRALGDEHPITIVALNYMGELLRAEGRPKESEAYLIEALSKCRRMIDDALPITLIAINSMGGLLRDQGKLAEAEPYAREALEKGRRLLGEENVGTLTYLANLGSLLMERGKFAEAEPFVRDALEKSRQKLGEEHPTTLTSMTNLCALLKQQGKFTEAETLLVEAVQRSRRVLGEEHPVTIISISNLGRLLMDESKLAEAELLLREGLEKRRCARGENHPDTLMSVCDMGQLRVAQGKYEEAIDLLANKELAARGAFKDGNTRHLATFLTALGRARRGLGYDAERFALAESNLLESHPIFLSTRGEKHKDTLDCARALVDLYAAWEKAAPRKGYEAKAAAWKAKLPVDDTASHSKESSLNPSSP